MSEFGPVLRAADAWHIFQPSHNVVRSTHCTVSGSSGSGGQSPRPVVPPRPLSRQGGGGGGAGGGGGDWARNTGSHILTCERCMVGWRSTQVAWRCERIGGGAGEGWAAAQVRGGRLLGLGRRRR